MGFCGAYESKRGYVTLSLVGAVAKVLLQISWVLPNAACVPALCLTAWHSAHPCPARPRWRSLWSPRLEETLLSLLSSAAVSSSFLLCALFQKVKNMAPAIGGWDSARETQMSGDRKVQPVSSSFWFKDSGQLSSQCFFCRVFFNTLTYSIKFFILGCLDCT